MTDAVTTRLFSDYVTDPQNATPAAVFALSGGTQTTIRTQLNRLTMAIKEPCRVATQSNVLLTGLQTIDGVLLAVGDRVLVKDQTDPVQNGIYSVMTGAWVRAEDFAGDTAIVQGTYVVVASGAVNGGFSFRVSSGAPYVVGTDPIQFEVVRNDGHGLPAGGNTGQLLAKASDANLDTEWIDPPSPLPTGGTTGQSLIKASDADHDVIWAAVPEDGDKGDVTVNGNDWRLSTSVAQSLPFAVSTRTALKALDTSRYAVAYLTENGREGLFTLNAGSPPLSDPAEGVYVTSNVPGFYWARDFDGRTLQATWFGVVADDSTDNATALQAAINFRGSSTTLLLPPGAIRIGGTQNVTGGFRSIYGSGAGTTLRRTFADGNLFYIANTAPAIISDINLGNFRVDHTVEVNPTNIASTIYVQKGDRIRLENITMGGGFYPIWLAGCHDVFMNNVIQIFGETTNNGRIGLRIEPSGAEWGGDFGGGIFLNNVVFRTAFGITPGQAGAQIGMLVRSIDGLWVNNCYFGYFSENAVEVRNSISGTRLTGLKFSNCWFDNSNGAGVNINGTTGTSTNHKFSNCTFVGGGDAAYGLRIQGNATFVDLNGCSFQAYEGDGVRIEGTARNITINGNQFSYANLDAAAGGAMVHVIAGNRININNNNLDGISIPTYGANGIQMEGGSDINVIGNTVTNCVNGILLQNAVDYCIVDDNSARGNTVGVNNASSGANNHIGTNIQ